jgi:hypothetical protein
MTHLSDDDLVLLFYREAEGLAEAEAHLASCAGCRDRFEGLASALREVDSAAVPERDESYGARVWARLRPRIEAEAGRSQWRRRLAVAMTWPRLAMGGAIAVLLVAAFLAGRSSVQPGLPPEPQRSPGAAPEQAALPGHAVRERAMLAAVGDHLDRSRVVLTEIAHLDGRDAADISSERSVAADLVAANRLYRQAAVRNGDAAVAAVLEDLERTLVEIANSPSPAPHDDLVRWRDQIDARGLLFKVTVMGSRVRDRQQDPAAWRPTAKTST